MDVQRDIPENTWVRWKRKRRHTTIGFLIAGTMVGIDYTLMFTTLYLYLKDIVQTSHPTTYYGLIIAIYSLSSFLLGIMSGRWVDRTRKIKLYTITVLIVQIIGCVLYMIHFNVAYPLIGRAIGGLGDPFPSVITGEVIRTYDKEESTKVLFWLASVYSVGFTIAPLIAMIFQNVDFYIGRLHIMQFNCIAIFMASLLLIGLIITFLLIHDCSAEIDLKEYLKRKDTEKEEEGRRNQTEDMDVAAIVTSDTYMTAAKIPILPIVMNLMKNVDSCLLFISTFVFVYCLFSAEVLFPLITLKLLDWSFAALTSVFVAHGVVYFFVLLISSKYCTSDRSVFIMSIVSIATFIITFVMLILMKVVEREMVKDVIFMVIFVIVYSISWVMEEVLIRCMLAKMVPSSCQSFTEGLRNGVSRTGTVVASFTSPLAMPYLHWWSAGMIAIMILLILTFIRRHKSLCNIKEIDFTVSRSPNNTEVSNIAYVEMDEEN